jgi:hypothetical protein
VNELGFPEFYNFLTSISAFAYNDEKICILGIIYYTQGLYKLKDKQEDMLPLMKEYNDKITQIKICRYREIGKDYLK